jgi:hypothetical protein
MSTRKRRRQFLDTYSASDTYLLPPKPKLGRPGLIEGVGKSGQPVLIREWRKGTKDDDRTLNELWRNELRLVYRLAGSPGAADNIASLIDADQDDAGYYIVIAAGQRRPIALYLPDQSESHIWQRQVSSSANRRRLWANLRRIAAGLEVLHLQGLIHCNLDPWSILSAGGSDPDFQLTGFEWSMRLSAGAKQAATPRGDDASRAYSFMDDWASFARIAATLLNLRADRLLNNKLTPSEVSEAVSSDEVSLLRDLIDPPHLLQIDGEYVRGRIDKIMTNLEDAAAADEARYYLVVGTDQGGKLSKAIREASGLSIEIDDAANQLEFIKADLSQDPRLLTGEARYGEYRVLRGVQLVYSLAQYLPKNSQLPSWEFAKAESAEASQTWRGRVTSSTLVSPAALSIMSFGEAAQRVSRLRGRVLNWDRLFEADASTNAATARQKRFLAAVTILHALELVLASAELFPVEIVSREDAGESEDGDKITLRLLNDPVRDDLWSSLGLRNFRERLRALLEVDAVREDEGWLLADRRRLSRRTGNDMELDFDRADFDLDPPTYTFRSKSVVLPGQREAVLIPGALRGSIEQFQRRSKAITGLRDHAELLGTLSDPRSTAKLSIDEVEKDDDFDALDPAKQVSMQEMFSVLPIYCVQGPPGVGKTFLVRDAVNRTFNEEPASRLLLSAQSHFAVDHLMNELLKDWKKMDGHQPLAVRSRSREAKVPESVLDVQRQRKKLIDDATSGALYHSASSKLRERLSLLSGNPRGAEKSRADIDKRTLDALVLRAANVVFATTNSRDLERLYDERGQFDWTIVEEAGKATGVELLMPLLLSHRRLMIGDHKQLPPFGSDLINRLLENPALLKKSLGHGLQFVERDFKNAIGDELMSILEGEETAEEMERLCADAKRVLTLFQTLVEDELARKQRPQARAPNQANVLTVQHRMHPAIAQLVSDCFYDGSLVTWPKVEAKFKNSPAPLQHVKGSSLQTKPIVVIDMPYQQTTKGSRHVEKYPRYTNPAEIDAVLAVLKNIAPVGSEKPSLAVLSPYGRQVKELRNKVNDVDPLLVKRFSPSVRGADWFSTVDSFQGNEADIVILSLVRNNHHSAFRSALGFLSVPERMNVALSRAKWRVYVVTSLDFLKTVTFPIGANTPKEIEHLKRLLEWLAKPEHSGSVAITPAHKLVR